MTAPETVGIQTVEETSLILADAKHRMFPIVPDELVVRAQEGCVEAQTETILMVRPVVLLEARTFSRQLQDVEDLAATAIEKIYSRGLIARKYSAPGNFNAWSSRVTHNVGIDTFRKQRVREITPIATDDTYFWDRHMEGASAGPLGGDDYNPSVQDILDVAGVSDVLTEAYLLHLIDGYSYEEIAIKTGVPIGTVRSRISRGHHQLMDKATTIAEAFDVHPRVHSS